ncbi:hypothetical protein VE00_05492 [Pseudogymnoascus sp. WSF 3629]|nr:hypothetical protein VE00_05492 [Pseudogymnoascus sp. WSF 3629]
MRGLLFLTLAANLSSTFAQVVDLGAAASFAVLGYATITNTGPTIADGDIGIAGASITGFPPGVFTGNRFISGQAAAAASDALTAYSALGQLPGIPLAGNLGGRTLGPGVYRFTSSAQLIGVLMLVGTGSSCDSWVFQIGGILSTSAGSAVIVTQGNPV